MNQSPQVSSTNGAGQPHLKRAITLPWLVLYGLGITIGAGIYVLIGTATEKAGVFAPTAFLVAAFVMSFSALSFAEFSGRIPKSAGEALYVDAAFGWRWLTLATGVLVVFAAMIAGAAIALGCAGYVAELVPLPRPVIVTAIVILMTGIAVMGVKESVVFAGVLTAIEIFGLLVIIGAGFWARPEMVFELGDALPSFGDGAAITGILGASLIAFFAFIGFDDVVNLVEETKNPSRTMPLAIGISLVCVTVIYFLVVFVATKSVPLEALSASDAPIGLMFERLTGFSPFAITVIAILATLNGVVIELIMSSRVLYGLGKNHQLPAILASIHPRTKTPVVSTLLVAGSMLFCALLVPLDYLVELTSQMILVVFALVNIALVLVKVRHDPAPKGTFIIPLWVPIVGTVACLALLFAPLILTGQG